MSTGRRLFRTLAWAAAIALPLWLLLPGLDWVGEVMGFPASYHTGARILLLALWLAGVAAVWAYTPPPDPHAPPPHPDTSDDPRAGGGASSGREREGE